MTDIAGLVLCGGRSRRMGREKALLDVGGGPLVLRVATRIASACDPVLLATGTPGRLGNLGYREVADARPNAGPLAGIVAGLEVSPHPLLAAVAVDMPYASPAVLRLLAAVHAGEEAVVPVTDSGPQPLHAVYAKRALPALAEALARGRFALREVLADLRVRQVGEPEWRAADPSGRFALNLNAPADLALLG